MMINPKKKQDFCSNTKNNNIGSDYRTYPLTPLETMTEAKLPKASDENVELAREWVNDIEL